MIYAKEEKGKMKIYATLPKDYQINGIKHNLSVLPIETINAEGFYELIVPTITETQRLEPLLPTDLVGNQYIQRVYDYTQTEIDAQNVEQTKQNNINTYLQKPNCVWVGKTPNGLEDWAVLLGNDGKLSTVKVN